MIALRRAARLLALGLAFLAGLAASGHAASPTAELKELIAARLALMEDVARSKWSTGAAIDDPAREAALLAAGAETAAAQGLDPAAVQTLLLAQIEAAKMVQRRWFAVWQAAGQGPFPDAEGLLAARRPEIARLSAALLPAWARARDELASCAVRTDLTAAPPELALDEAAWATAVAGATAGLPGCP